MMRKALRICSGDLDLYVWFCGKRDHLHVSLEQRPYDRSIAVADLPKEISETTIAAFVLLLQGNIEEVPRMLQQHLPFFLENIPAITLG